MKENNGTDTRRMTSAGHKPLFGHGESRGPMLASIGERLRAFYAGEGFEPMPPRLQALMRELQAAESRGSTEPF
jgi:hypothetical protein